jgi:hypothetical protein
VWWNYKIVKTAGPAEPSPIAGTWYMAQSDGSLGVGPAEFDVSWWSNDAGVTALRACYFDDAYVFGADGSFTNVQDGDTWLEPWQSGGAEECGAPVAPHDGSAPASFVFDAEMNTLSLSGAGAYIGIPKAINGAEIDSAAAVPAGIDYNAYLNEDGTMSVTVEAGDGVWWNYLLTR